MHITQTHNAAKGRQTTGGNTRMSGLGKTAGRIAVAVIATGAALSTTGAPLQGQDDEKELGWFYTAEVSLLLTAGNAEANTFGLGAGLRGVWDRSELRFNAGGLRTESSKTTRTAVGTTTDFQVSEESESEVTAQNYYLRGRYDYAFSDKFFAYGGTGWERNTFAGFDNRTSFAGGVGNIWVQKERTRFRTDYAVTYTIQDDIVDTGSGSDTFAGARFSWDYWQQLTSSTNFISVLIVDENLNDTDDLRGDFTNALSVSISDNLAFRTSLQLLWDNQPSLVGVPLEQPLGTPTGETVFVPLDKLDTVISVALVANF
jgi:putative salt-induced outer membrane protein YdiY